MAIEVRSPGNSPTRDRFLRGHDGVNGHAVAQVVQPSPVELPIRAHRTPACHEAVRMPSFGVYGKQERIGASLAAKRFHKHDGVVAEQHFQAWRQREVKNHCQRLPIYPKWQEQ